MEIHTYDVSNGEELSIKEVEANSEHCISDFQGNTSSFKTFFNGVNALSGIGILSTPFALASGGWWSFTLLLLIAFLTFYTSLLIQKCLLTNPNIRSFPDLAEQAFGRYGKTVSLIFMNLELYLVATGFLIVEGDNLSNLLPHFKLKIAGIQAIGGKQSFIIIVALLILPTVWLDDLSILAYVSACGVLASTIILGSVCYVGAFDGVGFHQKGALAPSNWMGIPTAISLYTFGYCAHLILPTLYTSMKNKHQFPNVLRWSFLCSTFFYAAMAVLGYLMFGSEVKSQITLNLPTEKISSKVAIYTTLVTPIAKYALTVTPVVNALHSQFSHSHNNRLMRLFIGTILVVTSVIVALTLPFFGYLMSLVGALLSVTCAILLPCFCYLKISGTYKKLGCELVIIIVIVLMGFAVGVFGTYTSIIQIIGEL